MVRSLLFLALVASVFSSANAATQVGGGIRGSSAAAGTEGSAGISSSLASAASSLLRVWPHPAAQVLHHATDAVRRKLQDEMVNDGNGGEDGEDENGENELMDEKEMGMTDGDTNTTDNDTNGDGDGDEPTGDGSFNDPEEGSLMDKLNDMAEGLKETAKQAMTDPASLSTGAKIGIGIGCFIIFMMLVCLIKCCCCRKKKA